jgi:hypothetical protein
MDSCACGEFSGFPRPGGIRAEPGQIRRVRTFPVDTAGRELDLLPWVEGVVLIAALAVGVQQ